MRKLSNNFVKSWLLVISLFMTMLSFVMAGNFFVAKADTIVPVMNFEQGASVRINSDGLRFRVEIDQTTRDYIVNNNNVTMGFFIAPTDLMTAANGNYAGMQKKIEVSVNEEYIYANEKGNYFVNGCVYNFKEENRTKDYTAVAFVKVDNEYLYSDLSVSRGIYSTLNLFITSDNVSKANADSVMSTYTWFGAENYPIVIADEVDYANICALVNAGVTFENSYLKVAKELVATGMPSGFNGSFTTDSAKVFSYCYEVNDAEEQYIGTITLPTANKVDSAKQVVEENVAASKVTLNGNEVAITNNTFNATVPGVYKVTYSGNDDTLETTVDLVVKGIEVVAQDSISVKVQVPTMTPHYSYGGKESWAGFEGNDSYFVRFKAFGNGGTMEVWLENENGEALSAITSVALNAEEGCYQIEIPTSLSNSVANVVFKNTSAEESGITATLTSVYVVKEKNPTSDRTAYYSDMYTWMPAIDNGYETFVINSTNGWNGWRGVSYGNKGVNYIAYLDSFGAALEYANLGTANSAFDGVQFFAKVVIPEGAKKLTYWAGHVGDPSAYRIQLFDGEQFVTLTESSSKVNASMVAANEGWLLTNQAYDTSALAEVAIPTEYVGKTVIVAFCAKFNNGSSYGIRFNNITFCKEEIIVPPTMSEGVDIEAIGALDSISGSSYSFANDMAGFVSAWGAEYNNGAIQMAGTSVPEGASANSAIYAKMVLPTSFNYLRVVSSVESGSVQLRVRMIDFETQLSSTVIDWTTISAKAGDQGLQIQSFPSAFVGTVGIIIETKYTEQATLNLKSISFMSAGRDAAGYDMGAIFAIQSQAMPENNKFTFVSGEIEKWSIFTSHSHTNTKGFANDIWLQLQSTQNTGDFSVLAAYKTVLGNFSTVNVKTACIGNVDGTSKIRVRALLADGTFVNFTKDGVTDANGWFDGCDDTISNTGWGGTTDNTIDVPESLANTEVILIVEYDKQISSEWNILLEHLAFE